MSASQGGRWKRRLASVEVLAVSGLLFAGLFLALLLLLRAEPPIDTSAEEVRRFFTNREQIGRSLRGKAV